MQETDAGKRRAWLEGLKHLADHDHVVCKVSGIVAAATADWTPEQLGPTIRDTLATFGPERVMFGGDWPVCTLRSSFARWVAALDEITSDRSAAERQKLFHDNAVRFYGLPAAGKKWRKDA